MPIYEAVCERGHEFEWYERRPISENKPCPECGSERTERVYSLCHPQVFQPFWTRHIDADGKPLYITSQRQLTRECRKNGVVPVEMDHSNDA